MIKSAKIVLLMLAVVAVFGSFGLSQAASCGTGGSPANHAGSCEDKDNDLTCGSAPVAGGISVAAGTGGFEVCAADGAAVPIEGRIGGDAACQCFYADGGNNNAAPANGWLRIQPTGDGITCGGDKHSYNQGGGSSANCG